VAFWATVVVVVVLVAYPVSWGPARWMIERARSTVWAIDLFRAAYAPIFWMHCHGPQPIQDALSWYVQRWVDGVPLTSPSQTSHRDRAAPLA